jgi:EF hand
MIFKSTSRNLLIGSAITLLAATAAFAQSTAPAAPGTEKPAAGGTAPAAASPGGAAEKPMSSKEVAAAFTKADTNKDGKLDKMEAEGIPGLAARFDQVDADGDKFVSKAELDKAMKP